MKIFSRIIQEARNVAYALCARFHSAKSSVQNDVPYVCQFATPKSPELSLTNELKAIDDPHCENTGASSPERYAEWAYTMCGMSSTLMALKFFRKDPGLKVAQLAEDALAHGVYARDRTGLSDMKYRPYSAWVRKYGITAKIYTRLNLQGIRYALSRGRLAIVSVNPNIRGYATASANQKGGHLVLVTGYDLSRETISINNPSGFESSKTQKDHSVTIRDFLDHYAGRGIVLSPNHQESAS